MKLFLILLQMAVLTVAKAETSGKQGLGLYSTSNANQTNDLSPDTFTQVSSRWSTEVGETPLLYGFSWLNYNKEKANNLLFLSLGAEFSSENETKAKISYLPRIIHRNYVTGQAATSDSSFTNSSLGLDVEFSHEKTSRWQNVYTVGDEVRHYPGLNRLDNEAHAIADFRFEATPRVQLFATPGAGILISNSSEYSRLFYDLSFGSEFLLRESLFLNLEMIQIQSIYFSRTISQRTEITNRRGAIVGYSTAKELTGVSTLKASVRYMVSEILILQSGLSSTSQSSNNPTNDYRSAEIFVSLFLKAP